MKTERRSARRTLEPELRTILLLTALAIARHASLFAAIDDWTNVGPVGGAFGPLAVDPQSPAIIYAGTSVGLFKSTDGGAGWNNAGLNGFPVSALIIDPQQPIIVYALTAGRPDSPPGFFGSTAGLFKSTDGGGPPGTNLTQVCRPCSRWRLTRRTPALFTPSAPSGMSGASRS